MFQAKAYSNIALIKYMGKDDFNNPLNPSLSFTSKKLFSEVTLKVNYESKNHWFPEKKDFKLNSNAVKRFLDFLEKLKKEYAITENFDVYSYNNFPMDAGVASSASSFAALTKAFFIFLESKSITIAIEKQALLSSKGSGSSSRSFYGPFCLWSKNSITKFPCFYDDLIHEVAILDPSKKKISSSMAHKIISTSEHLNIRQKNLPQRITKIKEALQIGNWRELYLLVKEESLCMHRLFTSSSPSFSYYSVENEKIFEYVELIWNTMHDGPLITMDAGPNVHLLYRKSQTKLAKFIKKNIQVKWI